MNFYSADKFSGPKTREDRRCDCGAEPRLAQMMDPLEASPDACLNASAANSVGPRTKSKAPHVWMAPGLQEFFA
jgi:hypothetical protein